MKGKVRWFCIWRCLSQRRGKKVLLIDADMRKSVLVGHYSIAGDVFGLAHYLSGLCDLEKQSARRI